MFEETPLLENTQNSFLFGSHLLGALTPQSDTFGSSPVLLPTLDKAD